jgi:hypothetical protein
MCADEVFGSAGIAQTDRQKYRFIPVGGYNLSVGLSNVDRNG